MLLAFVESTVYVSSSPSTSEALRLALSEFVTSSSTERVMSLAVGAELISTETSSDKAESPSASVISK